MHTHCVNLFWEDDALGNACSYDDNDDDDVDEYDDDGHVAIVNSGGCNAICRTAYHFMTMMTML